MDNNEMYSADLMSRLEYASKGEVPVRLTLTSRHILPDMSGVVPPMGQAEISLFPESDAFEQFEEELEDILEDAIDEFPEADEEEEEEEDGIFTFCTTAGMKCECGVITISYEESPSCNAEIIFDTGKPEMVTIHRSGGIMNTLVLEKGKRHISVYKTPIMPFEAAAYAKKVDTALTYEDGGEIHLDYLIELRGTDLQRTEMTIRAEKM